MHGFSRPPRSRIAAPALALVLAACVTGGGPRPLAPAAPSASGETSDDSLEQNLRIARAAWEADPTSEQAAIWVGRRLAYLGRYQEAVDWFSARLQEHPHSYRLLRHRGHRYLSLRQFALAAADLERAAELIRGVPDEIEPDGAPNAAGIPRSTTHANIYYHLGLAHYLLGDYEAALVAYEHGMAFSQVNDDMLVATSNWLYATLRRLELEERARQVLAPIGPEMDLLENFAYWQILRLNQGAIGVEELGSPADALLSATLAYGIGNYYYMNGDLARAEEIWSALASDGPRAAFGTIAATADLERLRRAMDP